MNNLAYIYALAAEDFGQTTWIGRKIP